MSIASSDPDSVLLAELGGPPPLEQARSSLEYWTRRRASLPVYKRSARREADDMIRRCRERVAEAERRRYGTGLPGLIRRLLAGDRPSWGTARVGVAALIWMIVPRSLVMAATAFVAVWLLVGLLLIVGLVSLLS